MTDPRVVAAGSPQVPLSPGVAEYFAKREAWYTKRLEIAQALNDAGLNGWQMVSDLEEGGFSKESAYRVLEHEDRMTVLITEDLERKDAIRRADELLAKYRKPDVRP